MGVRGCAVTYAVGNILLAAWGPVIVALLRYLTPLHHAFSGAWSRQGIPALAIATAVCPRRSRVRIGTLGAMSPNAWPALALLVALAMAPAISAASSPALAAGPSDPKVSPAPGDKSAPESIPVPEVARQADEAGRLLRDYDALLLPTRASEALEKRLPEIASRIEAESQATVQAVEASPAEATLDALTAQWQTIRAELVGYINALARRATVTEEALDRLTSLRDTWTQTRADARASRAPAQVIDRIDSVLATVATSRTRLQEHRAAILVLQDRVARELAQCETVLGRIAEARHRASMRLLQQDGVPLWRAEQRASAITELPARVRVAIAADIAQMGHFVQEQRWRLPVQAAIFLGLLLLIRAARRRVPIAMSPGEDLPHTVRLLDRSISAALMPTLLMSVFVYRPPVPRSAVAVLEILSLVPALRIMRLLVDRRLVTGLYVLAVFFLTDIVRHLASVVPVLEQQIFLVEMLAGLTALGWWGRRGRHAVTGSEPMMRRAKAMRLATDAIAVAFAVATAAAVAGYMRLALLLGAGVLGNGYLAMVLYAGVRVVDGLVAFGLRVGPLRHLGMVRRHRPLLERRIHGLLRCIAVAGWVFFALSYFSLWNGAVTAAKAILGAKLERGSVSLSLGDVLVFAVTVAAAFVLSALIRFFLSEEVFPRVRLGRGLPEALSGVLHYALILMGFLLAVAALGIDLTKITIVAGALGVGIGFGLQNVVNNLVSGSIVLFERKINVGDAVQIGDVTGEVQQMGMRACTVRTWEGAEVIVPNASLTSEKVVNWTLSDRRRRIDVVVGVAYGTPPKKTLDILLRVARGHPRVLAEPVPAALFRGFGESALQFEMRVWTDRFDLWVETQSELYMALYAALREAEIEIPVPQREVRVREGDELEARDHPP